MTRSTSSLPLRWPDLCAFTRRAWLDDHRGELPTAPGALPHDAPVCIAACAQLGQRQQFATEAEAETYLWIGTKAQDAVTAWDAAKYSREDCRISVGCIRYQREQGRQIHALICSDELRIRWRLYRRHMRRQAGPVDYVRTCLSPRPAPIVTLPAVALLAAE